MSHEKYPLIRTHLILWNLRCQMHRRSVEDRINAIKNIKRLIRRKEKENEALDGDLEELALSVAERRNVNEANGIAFYLLVFETFSSP